MSARWGRMLPAVFVAWSAALLATIAAAPRGPAGPAEAPASLAVAQEAGYLGTESCIECHDQEGRDHEVSVHYQTESGDWPAYGCESCHGPGENHLEDPENLALIVSFDDPDRTVADKVDICLTCHARDEGSFTYESSDHMKGTIDCAACHKPHLAATRDLLLPTASETACLSCHEEVRTELNLNERHRVLEGMVACSACHEQHAPGSRARLGGFKQETCISCHTDKGGPFVFEHLSVRIEGCTTCHAPHGSPNRHMLQFQSAADLCFSCHVAVPGFHSRFDSTTNCMNCHSSIHGSNLHPAFLR